MSRRNVLIVEDHPGLRRRIRACLEGLGFFAHEVSNGRTALAWLEKESPELVCLDLSLPEGSGFELCEEIRKRPHLKGTSVLAMAESRHPETDAWARESGADDFLPKPFSERELQKRVRELFSRGTAHDAAT